MKTTKVTYVSRFYSDTGKVIAAARALSRKRSNIFLLRIEHPDQYSDCYMVELGSIETGPALPYYNQLDHTPTMS